MVPESYHSFFSGCVSVSGALIGLLFVAISVAPHKVRGDAAPTAFQVKSGVAFTSLINALVISLVALLPGNDLGGSGLAVSITGLSSAVGLLVLALRDAESASRRIRTAVRFAALLGLFVVQLVNSIHLLSSPHDTSAVGTAAVLTIVCFLIAIDRAWELLGGSGSGMLSVFGQLVRERQATVSPDDQPGPVPANTEQT